MPASYTSGRPSDAVKRLLPWLVAVAFFMESLDTTILNTAVPVMAKALSVPLLSMKVVLASYTLSLAISPSAAASSRDWALAVCLFYCHCSIRRGWG